MFQKSRLSEEMTSAFKTAKKNQSLPLVKPTTYHYPQASPVQDSPSTASTKALPGKREELLVQLKVQKINASGNTEEALSAKVECHLKLQAPAPPTVPRRGRGLRLAQQETLERVKAHQPDMNISRGSHCVAEYTENFGFPQTVHPTRASKKTAHPLVSNFQSTPATLFSDKYRRTEYQAIYGPKKNQSLPLLKPTTCRYPQASPVQDSPSTASTKALPGKREELLEQLKVQKLNTSGNTEEALSAKVECHLKLQAPAPPTVPRRGRGLRLAQQETLERVKAHQPDMNTSRGSHCVAEYKENFGFPQIVHPTRALKKTAHPLVSNFQSTPATLFADKYRRTEYQAIYGPKKNQSLPLGKPTTCRYPQASPVQDSPSTASTKALPGKREELLEQLKVQKLNTSGNTEEALSAKVECHLKLQAPAPPTVPRRGRGLRLAQQETLERVKAHQPDMNTSRGSHWVTEYTENFGFPQIVHPTRASKKTAHPLVSNFQSTPATLFADKYRRTEYQAIYGPKIRTALFNATLYRQIHGTA